jgi:hypothetical protein
VAPKPTERRRPCREDAELPPLHLIVDAREKVASLRARAAHMLAVAESEQRSSPSLEGALEIGLQCAR